MADYLFPPARQPAAEVAGKTALYPVSRIFCVGRNYAEHAREMGHEVDREAPFYFLKPAVSLTASSATIPYPPGTSNLHHEMELVFAIGTPAFRVEAAEAMRHVYAYGSGLDMTRRDLQQAAREKGRPWDLGKGFENSAVLATLTRAESFGTLAGKTIALSVNGARRQLAKLDDMVWSVAELIAHLSRYYHLAPGDLIYTGTPAGVGAVVPGDVIEGTIDGLEPVRLTIGPAD